MRIAFLQVWNQNNTFDATWRALIGCEGITFRDFDSRQRGPIWNLKDNIVKS